MAAPAPPAPPPQPTGELALELAMFAMADELDLPARRLRVAVVRLLTRLAQAGFSLDSARLQVEARIAGGLDLLTRDASPAYFPSPAEIAATQEAE